MSGQGSKLWFRKSGLESNSEKLMIGTGIDFENFCDWDSFADPCESRFVQALTVYR